MNREEYVEMLVDYYEHPRNRGPLEGAELHGSGGNPGCGDLVTMYAHVDEGGHLTEVGFEGEGCTISQAAASLLTEVAQGMSLQEIEAMSYDELIELLGREVVSTRPRCATLGLTILKAAARDYAAEAARAKITPSA